MEGTIVNFRSGRHTQYDNQMIVVVDSLKSREDASKLVGKKVVFKTESGKELTGEVRSAHGNSGALRVLFETGMPGQSKGKKVSIN
ncbi:50S ribosomal protein L35ae [Candidatus Woesearchaeota archaeon]|nr:MAG: 50S ribosomal protein L35ae [Candidatus Woesearchaeota archaeon]